MAFVPAPNIVQVEIIGQKDGQIIENRFHLDLLARPTAEDLQAINEQTLNFVNINYAPLLPADVTVTAVRSTSKHTQNDIQLTTSVTIPGLVAGDSMPNEVSYCVSLKSQFIGRSARGRFYALGLSRANVVNQNRVGGAYRSAIVAAVQNLIDRWPALGWRLVIVSYQANKVPRPGGPVYFVVTTASTSDDIVDSQRRRKPGVGQ